MANFAAQLKQRFLGLVDRVTGRGAAAKEEATKPAMKEVRAYVLVCSTPCPAVPYVYSRENSACVLFVAFAARRDSIESSQRVRRIRGGSQLARCMLMRLKMYLSLQIRVPGSFSARHVIKLADSCCFL